MSGLARDKRNAVTKAVYFLRAKARCKSHVMSCFLDEQPAELVPRQARPGLTPPAEAAELVVNSTLRYLPEGDPPVGVFLHPTPLDGLLRGHPMVWLQDPGTDLWMPFWARGASAEALRSLRPGQRAPTPMAPAIRHALAMADVLVPPGYEAARRARWEEICRAGGAQFRSEGYAVIRHVIHPVQLGAMRQYYRALVATGRLSLGDPQVAERYRLHSEPVASFLHPQLAGLVSRMAGEPVKPSYVYFSCYQPGSLLPPHQDREQCEFSISLLVDYVPEPDGPCGWPLFLKNPETPDRRIAADLGLGDAIFYRGRQLVHYREKLPDGHVSTSLFFHYVREDFAGDLF
jgi:hypothetical protein